MLKSVLVTLAKKLIPILWDLMIPEIEKWLQHAIKELGEKQQESIINALKNQNHEKEI
jgi:hypothetical protein